MTDTSKKIEEQPEGFKAISSREMADVRGGATPGRPVVLTSLFDTTVGPAVDRSE